MKKVLSMLLLSIALVSFSTFAQADTIHKKTDVESMMKIMQAEGYVVEIDEDGDILWRIDGFATYILIPAHGEMVQFYAIFTDSDENTPEKINQWNRSKSYSRSYWTVDGYPVLELDLDFAGGVTEARIKDYLMTARLSFATWINEVLL